MCVYKGATLELDVNCNRCKKCGIDDAKKFLEVSIPVDIFKVQNSENPFAAIKLSNRVSTNVIALLSLKVDTIKDMMFAEEKFPIPVYSTIEYVAQILGHTYMRVGLWFRDLAGSGILCPMLDKIVINTFNAMMEVLEKGIGTFYPDFLSEVETLWGYMEDDFRQDIEKVQPPTGVEEYYHLVGGLFIPVYKFFDKFCYLITSYASLKEGRKVIYIHKSWQDNLREFLKDLVYYVGYPEKLCIVSKELTYEVEIIKKEMRLEATLY